MKRTHLLIWLLLCPLLVVGQNFKQAIKYGDDSFAEGDFYGASLYYKKALVLDSTDIDLLWKHATALRLYNNYRAANYYYAKIYKKERGRIFPESAFWLASMQKQNGQYKQALKSWKKFYSKNKRDKKSYNYLKAKQELASCQWAREHEFDSLRIAIKNVGKPVNSYVAEFGGQPVDDVLYFSSLRAKKYGPQREVTDPDYKIKLFRAEKSGDTWTAPTPLDSTINQPDLHTANGFLSPDGKSFYFTRCTDSLQCSIYVSTVNAGGNFGAAKRLSNVINQGNTTQPYLVVTPNKTWLFFVSDREGSIGGLDIWYSELKDGVFQEAKNAGPTVNTLDHEVSPFYDAANQTLYFSSQWHEGFGGFDIFKAKGIPGRFEKPENLLKPFNSPANDFYYSVRGKQGILTSNRIGSLHQKSPTCCNDLYTFDLSASNNDSLPYTSLEDLNRYLPVTLYFHNDEPDPRTTKSSTKQNYIDTYQKYLGLRKTYVREYSNGLSGSAKKEASETIEDFFTDYVEQGASDLAIFSKLLLVELEKGQQIELAIKGFASPLAETDYNLNLTKRRISSLENYLRQYYGGVYLPYIEGNAANGGRLTFVQVPFGENEASKSVSDNLADQKNSIYSKAAALERKIQVISVQSAPEDTLALKEILTPASFDFGPVVRGDQLSTSFDLKNESQATLEITEIKSSCGCTSAVADEMELAPGAQTQVHVTFDTTDAVGPMQKQVLIFFKGIATPKVLTVTSKVNLR